MFSINFQFFFENPKSTVIDFKFSEIDNPIKNESQMISDRTMRGWIIIEPEWWKCDFPEEVLTPSKMGESENSAEIIIARVFDSGLAYALHAVL